MGKPRTALAYKFKANADGTIDLKSALSAVGVPTSGCASCDVFSPAACSVPEERVQASPVL